MVGIGETLEKTVDDEGKPATNVCNCGEKAVLTVFEVVVLIAIAVFLIYVACGVTGHFKAVYLKRNQASLLKKQKAEQQATDTGDRVILNSIGVEVAVLVKLSLLFLVAQAGGSEKNWNSEEWARSSGNYFVSIVVFHPTRRVSLVCY